jgi:H+/Cl- antiporter ClcA
MLPLDKPWYAKLLLVALALGAVGGVAALLYTGITDTGIEFFFGNTGPGWWSGNWWWIPLAALGGLTVALLRKILHVSQNVPGAIALAQQAWVDPASALNWVFISIISLISGASLGPSFGLIVMGGGLGSWIVTRLGIKDEEAQGEYTLTGMAGGLGAAFSAPLFAAILASELSPTSKRNYVAAFIPQIIAATIGFVIFFGVTGTSILGVYELPDYEFRNADLLLGVLLGVLSAFILILFALIKKLVSSASAMISNPFVLAGIGGALVGLIAFALPLTATSGSSQLATVLQSSTTFGVGFIVAILIGKMFAIALSQSSGFLGGVVFPIIFIGGTAGLLVHTVFPDIPIALAVGSMLAAVPGAFLNAPLTLILIAVATIGIEPEALIPIAIAVVTSHISLAFIQTYVVKTRQVKLRAQ